MHSYNKNVLEVNIIHSKLVIFGICLDMKIHKKEGTDNLDNLVLN